MKCTGGKEVGGIGFGYCEENLVARGRLFTNRYLGLKKAEDNCSFYEIYIFMPARGIKKVKNRGISNQSRYNKSERTPT